MARAGRLSVRFRERLNSAFVLDFPSFLLAFGFTIFFDQVTRLLWRYIRFLGNAYGFLLRKAIFPFLVRH